MKSFYRVNLKLTKKIELDKADKESIDTMNEAVNDYMKANTLMFEEIAAIFPATPDQCGVALAMI